MVALASFHDRQMVQEVVCLLNQLQSLSVFPCWLQAVDSPRRLKLRIPLSEVLNLMRDAVLSPVHKRLQRDIFKVWTVRYIGNKGIGSL